MEDESAVQIRKQCTCHRGRPSEHGVNEDALKVSHRPDQVADALPLTEERPRVEQQQDQEGGQERTQNVPAKAHP